MSQIDLHSRQSFVIEFNEGLKVLADACSEASPNIILHHLVMNRLNPVRHQHVDVSLRVLQEGRHGIWENVESEKPGHGRRNYFVSHSSYVRPYRYCNLERNRATLEEVDIRDLKRVH